jgi:hypothetical protein
VLFGFAKRCYGLKMPAREGGVTINACHLQGRTFRAGKHLYASTLCLFRSARSALRPAIAKISTSASSRPRFQDQRFTVKANKAYPESDIWEGTVFATTDASTLPGRSASSDVDAADQNASRIHMPITLPNHEALCNLVRLCAQALLLQQWYSAGLLYPGADAEWLTWT